MQTACAPARPTFEEGLEDDAKRAVPKDVAAVEDEAPRWGRGRLSASGGGGKVRNGVQSRDSIDGLRRGSRLGRRARLCLDQRLAEHFAGVS